MQKHYPTLFISHGAPDLVMSQHAAASAFKALGQRFSNPKAIVMISAHWISDPIAITASESPATIHDFSGFPETLYTLEYPAPGEPQLAESIAQHLEQAGLLAALDKQRGIDHGTWIPLMLMYPQANIPVVQVSLPPGDIDQCTQLGEVLAPLRDEGVLIIGSGSSVHNLRALTADNQQPADWVIAFEEWLLKTIEGNHYNHASNPKYFPQEFNIAHPTIEHYLPLIVAWAAADKEAPGKLIHQSFTYGNLGMSFYEFG
ncbi:MAG: dioxygenase [Chromatiales bacterium]|nr:dioxygenase [Chromatiales bacterium]